MQIIYFIEYQANKTIELCSFLLRCGSWRNFVVAVGAISLWQLAQFRCDSWRNFVVAVGAILLGNIYASLPKNVFGTNRKGAF